MMRNLLSLLICIVISFTCAYSQTPTWTNVGPIPFPQKTIGQVHGIGRCSEIKFHPSNPNKIYTASASGGLWYSADKGLNWSNLGTDYITNVQSASIAIDPTNDQVIYWGTGDANYYSSGVGVYKTTNGGSTWTLSNSGMGNRLVIEMLILPTDNQTIIAATNGGIYKSTNGGGTWTLRSTATAMYDMVFKPGSNGQTVYAAAAKGFYRSTDAGNTWSQITSTAFVFGANGTRVAVSAANANVVYVGNVGAGTVGEIYKSTDGGTTFVNARSESTKFLAGYDATGGGQGNYNFDIEVNPSNANEIYLCAHVIWRSTDGGSTWTQQQTSWAYNLHTDQHHILFDPYVTGQLWNANDGGVWSNTTQGTGAWTPKSDGIAATEIYHAATSNVTKQLSAIGTQDNGGFYFQNGTWYNNRGGDWPPTEYFDYSSSYVYSDELGNRKLLPGGSTQNLNLPFTASSSVRTKYAFTPANTSIAYIVNAGKVYRCSNLTSTAPSWTLIYTMSSGNAKDIEVDPGNADVLYVSADNQKVYRSDNATAGTPTFTALTLPTASTNGAYLAPIKSSSIVYASAGNKLYRSADKGATWTDISSGFPSANINGLVADRFSTNEAIYASYSLGVYYKDVTKTSWVNYSQGLPIITDITDVFYFNDASNQGVLRVSFYGRGMWETPLVGSTNDITVSLTAPTNGSTYTSPATINLTANATSASGITKVEFYNGTTLLGSDASSPYTFTWTPVGAGVYSLTAVAYNSLGATKTSLGISITVNLVCNPLTGTAFGTSPAYAAGSEFDKAFDGNTSTYVDLSAASGGYTGIDLGAPTVLNGIRFFARSGWSSRMNGGIFQASNVANFSSGVVNLYTIPSDPGAGWNEVSVLDNTPYRYVRYFSAPNGNCNVAEIQFCGTNNQSPTVTITAPANNAVFSTVPATINITANATDPDGTISKVEFYNGTTLIGTDNSSPFSYSWTSVGAGTYQLTAKAYDNLNATTTSTVITIIVGNQSPTVSITSPANGASFAQPATISINATASDPDGTISKVEFYSGTTLLSTDNSSPYSYVWSGVAAGNYQLTAKAYDNSTGVTTSSIINVSVGNQNPVVLITTPSTGSNFTAPGVITINALASDIDGTISKVEFYNGATLLSSDATSPYSYNWTGVALGTYTITAKAYDNANATTTSTAVTINVTNGCAATAWSSATTYLGDASLGAGNGEKVSYNGRQYRAMFWTQNNQPDLNSGTGKAWTDLGACGSVNQSPTTTITAPINNATYSPLASISITATATDADGTIAKVQFYQGTTLLGQAISSPYTFTWNSVAAGTYQLTAVATDNSGATGTSGQVTVIVNQAPIVSITAPANNAVYTTAPASVNITASASSATGTISKVEFYNGASLLGSSTTSPYTYAWTGVISGTYSITVKAYDNLGMTATSSAISIRVNQAPVVIITAPVNNAVYTSAPAAIALTATATDADGNISKVEFYNGTTLLGTSTTSPYNYNWTGVGTGTYSLTAKAYDNDGTITTSSVTSVRVNVSPSVSITAPANNAVYASAPATIALTATATDADGTISKVEFYNGTTLLGTSTTSPYVYNWTNVVSGIYSLTAKAYDNNGAITTSSIITIRVNASPTVTITTPVNNAVYNTVPATVAITATATDVDGTINKVEFYNGTTLLGTITTSPYTYNWTNVTTGTYSITVKAYDNNGTISTSSAVSIKVNTAPVVSITAPANNTTYIDPATTTITASASDPDGTISKVEFYSGTTLLGTSTTSPYNYNWSGVTAGTYSLTAKAYDNDGSITTSGPISVVVNANAAPTVSITSPLNNAIISPAPATVTITANSADTDGTISKVEFYNGTTLLGTATSSPYTYNWINVTSGTYTLTAKAYDNLNATTVSAAITVIVNAAPIVSITAPANNATFIAPANVSIAATATDGDGTISKVEFYSGSTLLGTSTSSPYTYNWTAVVAGSYALTAKAYDNRGTITSSSVINITVNTPTNQSPTVNITAPSNNATYIVPATIVIAATATDADGTISKVEFYNGTTLLGTSISSPYVYNWTGVASGTYSLTAKAYDNLNSVATSSVITIVVNNNNLPLVSITSPVNNAYFIAPASIIINATATDADGSVSKVEFYNGTTLLGTSTSTPYSYTWNGVVAGTYSLTAKAYDNLNAVTTSSLVSVTVNNNVLPTISITSPSNGASFIAPASITINATANDADGTISKVEFYSGTTLLNTDNASPYSFNWSSVVAGTYSITAKAYDNLNAVTTSSVVNISVGTNASPVVTITTPVNNTSFLAPANVVINATATDSDGSIGKVEFYNGTTLLGTSTSSPFSYNWTGVSAGNYSLTAKAYDNLNAVTTSSIVGISVSNNALPTVTITSPSNGANFIAPATFAITASASDPDGTISKVEFYNGSVLLGTSSTSPYSFNWSNVSSGSYSITAKAYDNLNGVATSSSVTVTVNNNQSPIVSITSPANNTSYMAPATITLTASAADFDGTVNKVEFYNGTLLVGTSTTSPYSYVVTNIAAGTYTITAKAYDNMNAVGTSSAITIIVNGCAYSSWSSTSIYTVGNRCERNGNVYEAKWWTQNNDPLTNSGQYDVWKLLGACGTNLMPSLFITTNATNDTLSSPANFSVNITSHDDESYVAKVEIYNMNDLVSQYFTGNAVYDFTNLQTGHYEIYVKSYDDQGNVAVSDTLKFFIQSPLTGIFNPGHNSKLNVYPNPVTGRELNIDYPSNQGGPVYISIIDLNGKELLSFKDEKNSGGETEVLNVGALQPGTYILKMNMGGKEYEEKVQKASKPKIR